MKTIGERIERIRLALEMSRKDLGMLMNFNNPEIRIGSYETDKRIPSSKTVDMFAEVFDVTSDYLLTGNFDERTIVTFSNHDIMQFICSKEELINQLERMIFLNESINNSLYVMSFYVTREEYEEYKRKHIWKQ